MAPKLFVWMISRIQALMPSPSKMNAFICFSLATREIFAISSCNASS